MAGYAVLAVENEVSSPVVVREGSERPDRQLRRSLRGVAAPDGVGVLHRRRVVGGRRGAPEIHLHEVAGLLVDEHLGIFHRSCGVGEDDEAVVRAVDAAADEREGQTRAIPVALAPRPARAHEEVELRMLRHGIAALEGDHVVTILDDVDRHLRQVVANGRHERRAVVLAHLEPPRRDDEPAFGGCSRRRVAGREPIGCRHVARDSRHGGEAHAEGDSAESTDHVTPRSRQRKFSTRISSDVVGPAASPKRIHASSGETSIE